MKIEWLEHLEAKALGVPFYDQQPLPMPMDFTEESASYEIPTKHRWRWDLHLGYRQVLDSNVTHSVIEEHRMKAAQAIARTIYGPVIDDLVALRSKLLDEGLDYMSDPIQHIEDMIKIMELR